MKALHPVLLLALATPAAALTPSEIGRVGAVPPADARAPLDLPFRDDADQLTTLRAAFAGKPGLLVFADYTCTSLCGPALVLTKVGLEQSGLRPGADYHLAVVGLNPKDGPTAARAMRRRSLSDDRALDSDARFLIGDAETIRQATRALGYRYVYDAAHDQYAHPAVAFVLAPDGRLARVVSEIGLTGPPLRQALLDAGGAGTPNVIIRGLHILCYGFDPEAGIYNGPVMTAMRWSAGGALALGLLALLMLHRRRRTTAS
jgi:protein SCO1/2